MDFRVTMNKMLADDKLNPITGAVTNYDGIEFRSRLECEWYKKLKIIFPDHRILYEPGTFMGTFKTYNGLKDIEISYTPDFVIMPPTWMRPNRKRAYYNELRNAGVFVECKAATGDMVTNNLHLVGAHVVLLRGIPHQGGKAYVVKTWGSGDRERWKTEEAPTVTDAVNWAAYSIRARRKDPNKFIGGVFRERKKYKDVLDKTKKA